MLPHLFAAERLSLWARERAHSILMIPGVDIDLVRRQFGGTFCLLEASEPPSIAASLAALLSSYGNAAMLGRVPPGYEAGASCRQYEIGPET
jgi:hypothetical protein